MTQQLDTTKVGDAGTRDVKVQRIEEGIPGLATVDNPNPTAATATFNTFDAGFAVADKVKATGQIDTQWEANGLPDQGAGVKRGDTNAGW